MSIFDLLFLALVLAAVATLITAAVRWRNAPRILRNLAICATAYIAIVYAATALSAPKVLHVGDPNCLDDWCFQVDHADRTPNGYNVAIGIFSTAKRVAQTLLQPGESVVTNRTFNIPAAASNIGVALDRSNDGFPICLVIGECGAFHHATTIRF